MSHLSFGGEETIVPPVNWKLVPFTLEAELLIIEEETCVLPLLLRRRRRLPRRRRWLRPCGDYDA